MDFVIALLALVLISQLLAFLFNRKSSNKMANKEVVSKVQKIIQNNSVFVASKSYCPYCQSTLGTLQGLGVKPYVLQLNQIADGSDIQDALREITGQSTVPNIFIDGKHIGGNSDLQALKSTGELESLLKL